MGVETKIEQYVSDWRKKCYTGGIPDEVDIGISHLAPSWKAICMCILKNDFHLKGLGFEPPRSKYYDALKKIELSKRGISIQLKFQF